MREEINFSETDDCEFSVMQDRINGIAAKRQIIAFVQRRPKKDLSPRKLGANISLITKVNFSERVSSNQLSISVMTCLPHFLHLTTLGPIARGPRKSVCLQFGHSLLLNSIMAILIPHLEIFPS